MADIVTTLRERPFRLASESDTEMRVRRQAEREYAAHEIEVLRLEKAKIATDNERLRAALKSCIAMLEQLGYTPISKIARAALDAQPAPGKEEA